MGRIRKYIEEELGYETSFKTDLEAFLVTCFMGLIVFIMPINMAILILVDGQGWGWAISIGAAVMGLGILAAKSKGANPCF